MERQENRLKVILMKFNKLIPELSVRDINKSIQFYTETLGFKVEYQREDSKFAFLSLQGSQLMLEQTNDYWKTGKLKYPFGRGINFQIEVDNIDDIVKKLGKNKWPIKVPLKENWYRKGKTLLGQKEFLVMDPDGYLLRFAQSTGESEQMPIRGFREEDEVACAEVAKQAIESDKKLSTKQLTWLIEHETKENFLARSKSFDALLVYQENGRIVGVTGLNKGELRSLYVLPEFQQKGIGTKLLKAVEQKASQKGYTELSLEANPSAKPFYERLGYRKTKESKIKDIGIKVILMEKELWW